MNDEKTFDIGNIMGNLDFLKITRLIAKLSEIDIEKMIEIMEQIDIEKMLLLMKTISDNADSLIKMMNTLKKLDESGILPMIDTVAEMMDENFNAIARPEIMKAIGNLMMLVNLLSQLDHGMLMDLSMKLPKCIDKAKETFDKTEKGMGTFELMGAMKTPEMAATIKAMQELIKCTKGKCE